MKSLFCNLSILLIFLAITASDARSFLDDEMENSIAIARPEREPSHDRVIQSNSGFTSSGNEMAAASSQRTKRSVHQSVDQCPVHPDTPVRLGGKDRLFQFNVNEEAPAPLSGENEHMDCVEPPPQQIRQRNVNDNFFTSCPWKWVTNDTWTLGDSIEYYPRYVKQAYCLCNSTCVGGEERTRCQKLERELKFYEKVGCQGNKPVFEEKMLNIAVGCYCDHALTVA